MTRHVFPYVADERLRPGKPPETILRPLIAYTVEIGGEFWSADALVDTGSPRTLFKREIGNALNLRWHRQGAEYDNFDMLGGRHVAQRETVDLFLNRAPDVRWRADVWFFVEDWDWKLRNVSAIFGNDGFFDQWAVTFLRSDERFVVETHEDYRSGQPLSGARPSSLAAMPRRRQPGAAARPDPAGPATDPRTGEDWWRPTPD